MWSKVLKNKNFLFLLESPKGVISNLLELRKDYFTNEVHYKYYVRYVKPKLSMIVDTPVYSYRVRRYRYYDTYEVIHSCSIYVSQSYILISIDRKLYEVYSDNSKSSRNYHEYNYLLGFNSDGKLFINKVDNHPTDYDLPIVILIGNGSYSLSKTNDNAIRRVLGYDHDVDGDSEVVIDSDGIYRVQGEIVISVRMLEGIEDYYKWIVDRLKTQITDLVEALITDRISSILIDLGFNISVAGIDNILINDAQRLENTLSDKLKALSIALLEEIKKNFDVTKYELRYDQYYDYVKISVDTEYYGSFDITVDYDRRLGFNRYGNIRITIFHSNSGIIENKILEDLYNQLRNISKRDFKHVLGNHYIEVKNALSTNITYKPFITPLLVRFNELRLDNNLYYVDKDSEILISHKEHGICRVRITKPSLIEITTTVINNDYYGEINRVVLSNIYEKYMSKINQYFKNDVI